MIPYSLWFETPKRLHCSQTANEVTAKNLIGLRPLRDYTALKLSLNRQLVTRSLRPLRDYTALKRQIKQGGDTMSLRPLRDYTALKRASLL